MLQAVITILDELWVRKVHQSVPYFRVPSATLLERSRPASADQL